MDKLPSSHFTCTLGEAQLFNETLSEEAPYTTINEFIKYLARSRGDDVAVASAGPWQSKVERQSRAEVVNDEKEAWEVETLTFSGVLHLSLVTAKWLQSELQRKREDLAGGPEERDNRVDNASNDFSTVALYASSSLVYLLVALGWIRAGYKVILISTACHLDAVRHLMKACNAVGICYDERHETTILPILDSSESSDAVDGMSSTHEMNKASARKRPVGIRIPWAYVDDIRYVASRVIRNANLRSLRDIRGPDDVVLYGHSSGTSTGLPKLIPITSRGEIGALPRFHETEDIPSQPSTFTTTPIYTGGLADLWRSWSAAATLWVFPEDRLPITGHNIQRFLEAAQSWQQQTGKFECGTPIGYLSCVPFVAQMMAEDEKLMGWLRRMDMVGVGGAAMPTELGDRLVKDGVNIVSRYGSRECGFLLSSYRNFLKDWEWQYIRKHDLVDSLIFKKWNDMDHELVVTEEWPSLSPAVQDKLPFNSHDVFRPHPSIPNAWKYCGRSDVQITLVTGKKFDPAGIESAICTSKWVDDAVIVGDNRQYPAALIFLSISGDTLTEAEKQSEVWKVVHKVNEGCPSHARIERDMIKILPSSGATKIQKSSKGTVMRGRFASAFEKEIQELYEGPKEQLNGRPLELNSFEIISKVLYSIIQTQLGRDLPSPDSNFYENGVTSMSCMQIRNRIKARLSPGAASRLPLNIMYETGTLRKLVTFIGNFRPDATIDSVPESHNVESRMRDMAERFVKLQPEYFNHLSGLPSILGPCGIIQDKVVLLTGATGFLGAHILSELLQMENISLVILPVRVDTKSGDNPTMLARQRVESTLEAYKLLKPSVERPVVRCLATDLESQNLGLSNPGFEDIVQKVTHIVHGAWAVNFNIPLDSFEAQLKGLVNLYNVAALAQRKQSKQENPHPVSFTFLSSTASVTSSSQTPVPEYISQEPSTASKTGYGRSKWVAERILNLLAGDSDFPSINRPRTKILRIGQLCGSTSTGIWNKREGWPLMFDAGLRDLGGKIPDLAGAGLGRLDWLPVNLAAKSIVEIAFGEEQSQLDPREEGSPSASVYHILNCDLEGTNWSDVQEWLSSTNMPGRLPTSIVPAQAWLDELEALKEDHPAKSLIGLWREGWRGAEPPAAKTSETHSVKEREGLSFETARAESLSPTMRDGKQNMVMSKEAFLRMLSQILAKQEGV